MKTLLIALFGSALLLTSVQAEEKTLRAKCPAPSANLKQADTCEDTLKVGDTLYLLEEGGKRKTSEHVCSGPPKPR